VRTLLLTFGLLAASAQLATAQEACLTAIRPQITSRGDDTCRFEAAVANACGTPVRYVVVRAVPHPGRGPLPMQTSTAERFALQPLSFEREMCNQSIRFLELSADGGARDFTERPLQPETRLADVAAEAQRVNACVARCPAPVTDRTAIMAELRDTYRHALDLNEGSAARDALIDALVLEREARDRVCARICHGALPAAEGPRQLRALEETRAASTASAMAALAALAARPIQRAAPEPVIPAADESERRPAGQEQRGRGAPQASRCRQTSRGPRCSLVLDVGPGTRSVRQGRQRQPEARQQQRRGGAQQQRRRRR
jgi:hypothetical protein